MARGEGIRAGALLHLRDGKIVIAVLNPSQYHIPVGGGYWLPEQ